MKIDNSLFIAFTAIVTVGMVHMVCVVASVAPLICTSSGKCPDSYADQSTNEIKGITYCYSGSVEPDTAFEGNNQTITVDGEPIDFASITSCNDVTEDESNPDKYSSSNNIAVRQQQLSLLSSKFVVGIIISVII